MELTANEYKDMEKHRERSACASSSILSRKPTLSIYMPQSIRSIRNRRRRRCCRHARKFLYQFHEDAKIEEAQQALALGQASYIPEETAALRGLAAVNRDMVLEFGRRTKDRIATIDLDATIIESWKREAGIFRAATPVFSPWCKPTGTDFAK